MRDRRKYQRITYYLGQSREQKLEGASLVWPNGEQSHVFDLSYQGAAVSFPLNFPLEELSEYDLTLSLSEGREFPIRAQVRWFNNDAAGVQFVSLDSVSRQIFEDYFSDKLIGASLFKVDKQFYTPKNPPDCWYHGPQDTNLFLWFKGDSLDRLVLELDYQTMEFNGEKISLTQRVAEVDVKDQYQEDDESGDIASESRQHFYSRALSVLSQVEEQKPHFNSLFLLLRRP